MRSKHPLMAFALLGALAAAACAGPSVPASTAPPPTSARAPAAPAIGLGWGAARYRIQAFANDAIQAAAPVTSLPYTVTGLDLTTAEPDSGPDLIGSCFSGDPGKTVWYRVRVPEATQIYVDASASTVTGTSNTPIGDRIGLIVLTGTLDALPGSLSGVMCNWPAGMFEAAADTDYYLGVIAPTSATRADLDLTIRRFIPLEYSFTVDPTVTFKPGTKVATVSGTFTTNKPASAYFPATLSQKAGHLTIQGRVEAIPVSPGGTVRWTANTFFSNGYWAGGPAKLVFDPGVGGVQDPEWSYFIPPPDLSDRDVRLKALKR